MKRKLKFYVLNSALCLKHWQNILPVVVIFLLHSIYINAQERITEPAPIKKLKRLVNSIDTTEIKTGYLLNKGFLIRNQIAEYDSLAKNPSAKLAIITKLPKWKILYRGLFKSANDTTGYLKPLKKALSQVDKNDTDIPLGILNFVCNIIPDTILANAYNSNNIKISINNKNRLRKTKVFAIAPLRSNVNNTEFNFVLSDQYYFSNRQVKPTGIEIDMLDGSAPKFYSIDESIIPVSFSCTGEKALKFRLFTGSDTLECYSSINVKQNYKEIAHSMNQSNVNTLSNPRLKSGTVLDRIDVTNGVAWVQVSSDGVFDKPFVICEGWDYKDDWFSSDIQKYWPFYFELEQYGYDIVVLNLYNNTNKIENNVVSFKELIKKVNEQKTGNYELIVMGESMGGLIARYALKSLENEGYDHNTKLFIAWDTPFRGANVPMGLQCFAKDVNDMWIVQTFNLDQGMLDDLVNAGSSGAAREMMLRYYDANSTSGTAGPHADFYTFQAALTNLGYPAKCRNISILSGSDLGNNQFPVDFVPGCDLIKLHEYYDAYIVSLMVDMWAISNKLGTSTRVDQIDIDYYEFPFWYDLKNTAHVFTFDNKSLDNAPGGYVDMTGDATQALADAGFNVDNFGRTQIDFVNTSSALDINPAYYNDIFYTTVYKNYSFSMPPICYNRADLVANNITPFDDVYSQGENCSHYLLYNPVLNKFKDIFNKELMRNIFYLQNKTIGKTINYSSGTDITVGSNVESGTGRLSINTGDVVVNSGGNLILLAKNKITLKPGTKVNRGGKFYADVRSTGYLKSAMVYLKVPEITQKEKGVFEIKNPEQYGSINWKINNEVSPVTGKTYAQSTNFIPGLYTLTCTTTENDLQTSVTTTIWVENNKTEKVRQKNNFAATIDNNLLFRILENPCKGILKMEYFLNVQSSIKIEVINSTGHVVDIYENQNASSGITIVNRNINRLKSGIYYVRFTSAIETITKKVDIL